MLPVLQANYGGISVKVPKSLREMFSEERPSQEEEEEEEDVEMTEGEEDSRKTEVEMNWNICKYLPEAASCQDIFRVRVDLLALNVLTTI